MNIINSVIQIFNTVVMSIILLGLIFDAFFSLRNYRLLLVYIGFQALFQIFYYIFSEWFSNVYIKKSNYKIQQNIQLGIHNKYIKYDSIIFNNPENLNKYNWVNSNATNSIIELYESIINYIQNVIILILTGGIFIYFDPLFSLIISTSIIISFLCNIKQNKNYYKKGRELQDYSRYNDYIKRVFHLPLYRDDIKTSDIDLLLHNRFYDNHTKIIKQQSKANKRIFLVDIISTTNRFVLGNNLPYILLGLRALIYNLYTASELAVLVNVIIRFRSSLNSVISIYPQLKKNAMYLKDYYDFMDYEPEIKENKKGIPAKLSANSLVMENVSFSYDGEKNVLKNINLHIKAGEKIAIVGHNGAGKSTLIKLLLRLYLPQEGTIKLDNIKSDDYILKSYRNRFGVAFQNSVIYSASVGENVLMRPFNSNEEAEIVWQSLAKSGIQEAVVDRNLDLNAIMTKEFDENGIELSGGQNQKVALSRVFAKESGVIILDEPSSSLDPISEYEMYKNMLKLSEKRTFIIISHRLSITRDVDNIILLENGEIIEYGSHEQLIAKNGKYAEMWNIQAMQFA